MVATERAFLSAFLQVMINRMSSQKFLEFFNGQINSVASDLLEKLRAKMVSVRSVLDEADEKQSTAAASEKWLDKLKDAVYGTDDLLEEVSFEALRCVLEDEPQQQASKFQSSIKEKFELLFQELDFIAGKDEDSSQALESSHDLSHLELCSEYCAILPKGYEFGKEDLILLWMAAGLLTEMSQGQQCFQKLLSESFRQLSDYPIPLYSVTNNHSARSVSGDFFFKLEENVSSRDAKRIRHVSATADDAFQQLELIHEAQSLQTFFAMKPSKSPPSKYMNDGVLERLILRFKRLRVLSLSGYENITELSNSIGQLKHLRYLNVSETAIKRLPEYVCGLYFLETLILYRCKEFIELPTNMRRLINLYHLDTRGTQLIGMPQQLGALSKLQTLTDFVVGKESSSSCSIKELGMLQHLKGDLCLRNLQYVLDAEHAREAGLEGKNNLTKLELRWDVDTNNSDKVLEQLQPHTGLEHLLVAGYGGTKFPDWLGDSRFQKMASLNLYGCKKCSSLPPLWQLPCLQELSIAEFHGIKTVDLDFCGSSGAAVQKPFVSLKILRFEGMQNWEKWNSESEKSSVFCLLKELYIINCPKLKGKLPSFLPSLTTLEARQCGALGFGNLLPSAPSVFRFQTSGLVELLDLPSGMRCLKLENIPSLDDVQDAMQKVPGLYATIEVILVSKCNSVKHFYLEKFPNLKKINIKACQELESLFEHESVPLENFSSSEIIEENRQSPQKFPLIQEFCLRDCPKLTKALPSNLPSLQVLYVSGCHSLKYFQFKFIPNLKRVDISGCSNLESLLSSSSGESSNFPLLQELFIRQCPRLSRALPSHLPSLTVLELEGCHKIMGSSFPDTPEIRRIKLKAGTCHVVLEKSQLEIKNWDSLKCFPMDMSQFHELKKIAIISCGELESLSRSKELGDFKFLTSFEIWGCPKLLSFPKGKFYAPKLKFLSIRDCQVLKSLPEEMHSLFQSLQDLQLIDCPALVPLSEKSSPTKLEFLEIQGCPKLSAGSKLRDFLASSSSLSRFIFGMSEDVESFPGNMILPSTIKHLEIEDCPKVKSIDKGINHLKSIKSFTISNCPLLESMAEEGLLHSSLSSLSICNCPLLEKWCQDEKNLSKISHIECIKINYCQFKPDRDLKSLSKRELHSGISVF